MMFCPSHQTCSYEETGNSSLLLRKVQEYRNCVHDANDASEYDTFEDFGAYWGKKRDHEKAILHSKLYCVAT